jgi:hypothetical protein
MKNNRKKLNKTNKRILTFKGHKVMLVEVVFCAITNFRSHFFMAKHVVDKYDFSNYEEKTITSFETIFTHLTHI